jgi:hypothetical protein
MAHDSIESRAIISIYILIEQDKYVISLVCKTIDNQHFVHFFLQNSASAIWNLTYP